MATKKRVSYEKKVRVPPELMAELNLIAGQAKIRDGKEPVFGDLLYEAWRVAKRLASPSELFPYTENQGQENHQTKVDPPTKPTVSFRTEQPNNLPDLGEQDPEETEWARKFVYVLRHGDKETVEAITRNVERFSLLTRILNREPAANEELDRIARQIAADRERRLEHFRGLEKRYPASGEDPGEDEGRVHEKGKGNPPKTG